MTIDTSVPAPAGKLGRAGLSVINPPYGFEAAIQAGAALIAPPLETAIRAG
jgi:23S rRNA A2030 N6-methylase RlmJ